jgi:hypothetical protein
MIYAVHEPPPKAPNPRNEQHPAQRRHRARCAERRRPAARRRLAKGKFDIDAIEELAGAAQRDMGEETLAAAISALPPEDDKPKACPRCKQLVPVKAKNRLRHILTTAGELRVTRNYHHCSCGVGFSPRDSICPLKAKSRAQWSAAFSTSASMTPSSRWPSDGASISRRASRRTSPHRSALWPFKCSTCPTRCIGQWHAASRFSAKGILFSLSGRLEFISFWMQTAPMSPSLN